MSQLSNNSTLINEILAIANSLPEYNEGIDTSDATATAGDIVQGKTAYAADEKITGSIPIISGTLDIDVSPRWVNGLIRMPFSFGSRCALETGLTLSPSVEGSSFGDASAADVAKGKTFTSASGLNVVGTYEAPDTGAGGIELPELSNEGTAEDLVLGKQLINKDGDVVTGTNPYEKIATDTEVNNQADLIGQIMTALNSKTGTNTIYVGSDAPTDSIGQDGDIYIMR